MQNYSSIHDPAMMVSTTSGETLVYVLVVADSDFLLFLSPCSQITRNIQDYGRDLDPLP